MSKTPKTDPGKIKKARGEKPKSKRYPDQVAWWVGRDAAWQEAVKAESGRSRAQLRAAKRRAKDDPDNFDLPPPRLVGTEWVVY